MSSSTPSPPSSTATPSNGLTTTSRRPPRKSTLTQQQKNQKRQRATQDQLLLLEVEFNKNPTPTGAVRERIAQEINMTERSVQIWFQNRRAKIKQLAKKSIETGEDCDAIPESYRNYLAIQAMDSGKPLARNFMARGIGPMYGNGGLMIGAEASGPQKVVIHHFQCRSLSIGTWRRVGQNAMDLIIFYSLGEKPALTYYINNDSAGYKIEFPFAYIKNITLEDGNADNSSLPSLVKPAGLYVELNRPPNFYMDSSGSGGFYQCGDFTEDQQASQIMMHHLGGDPRVLSGQLAKLVSLESFQNRHNNFEHNVIAASAPVSPISHRPASQPNQMSHPHLSMFQESPFGMALHPGPRGHKRTRSRSVPAAIDFSMFHSPMPSFHIQHPSTNITDPSIFAPVPQHHSNLTPVGHNLRIDTTPGYAMDFRSYPMSATATSPSEYASPSFFTSGTHMDSMPASSFNGNYHVPFLSPMVEHPHLLQPSPSPLSAMSHHGDPVIADHSPPLSKMHRSNSADFLSITHDQSGLSDDGLMLSEMYSKQNLNLPMHSPGVETPGMEMQMHDGQTSEEMDMQHMLSFGTIDPSNLSPDSLGM